MPEESVCETILKTIKTLETSYIWLVDGPMYIIRDEELISYHEDDRERDMERISNNITKLNDLLNKFDCNIEYSEQGLDELFGVSKIKKS